MARRWLVVGMLLLALGGCGDETEAEPATVPVPVTSSEEPVPSRSAAVAASRAAAAPEQAAPGPVEQSPPGFVAVVQRELPALALDHRDDELVTLAQSACAALAADRAAGAVVAEVRTFGTDRPSARALVRLAIGTVCPEQDRRIDEF